MLSELLYADYLVMTIERIEGLRKEFRKWKEAFESKENQNDSQWRITKDSLTKSKACPCVICSFRTKANSVLCAQYGKWSYGRCAGVKMVTQKFKRHFACRICEENFGKAVEKEEKLCNEVETKSLHIKESW